MNPILLVCLAMVSVTSLAFSQHEQPLDSGRDFRPEAHFEEIPATNASVLQCYVFKTVPGVHYLVEVSNDLIHWTAKDEVYGLGHEYVVTMREFTPAPPPDPGAPPSSPTSDPTKCASIRMQPATGTGGGTVVAWRSLDNGGPVIVKIDGILHAGWASVPLYASGFGDYEFFVWHPTDSIDPPAENPPLGPEDTAMLAALEASLPAMNEEVATSAARSRNAPPSPPTDPDSLRFWRINVDAGIDTDTDGTPDWAEFEMAANGTGGMVAGVTGDAFNADTNNDGIPDGLQIDSDKDGTPDAVDPDPSDSTAFFPIGPVPRYAVFPITNAEPMPYWPAPFQINDQGTVLYSHGTWSNGAWTDLPGAIYAAEFGVETMAASINDLGEIIGMHTGVFGENGGTTSYTIPGNLVYWPDPTSTCAPLVVNGSSPWIGSLYDDYPGSSGTLFSNDGHLIGYEDVGIYDETGELVATQTEDTYLWTLPGHGRTAGKIPVSFEEGGVLDANHYWGYPDPPLPDNGQALMDGQAQILPPHSIKNLVAGPHGEWVASFKFDQKTQVYQKGAWHASTLYADAIDVAADGTAIGRGDFIYPAPICLNGEWKSPSDYAPGVTIPWTDNTVRLMDTTPGGWILAQRGDASTQPDYSVMLPIKADGVDPDRVVPPPPTDPTAPKDNPPEFLAGGVDHTSMTARFGAAKVSEIWIMAPNGGTGTPVRFQSPLNDQSKLTLVSEANVTFTPQVLEQNDQQVLVKGRSASLDATTDTTPKLKLGGTLESLSSPVKIKSMKRRTVRVAVHKVFGIDAAGQQTQPDLLPTESALSVYLSKVYGKQTNTFFSFDYYDEKGPAGTGIDFDLDNSLTLGYGDTNPEQSAATPNAKALDQPTSAHIDIWVIGGGVKLKSTGSVFGSQAAGFHFGGDGVGKIIINGDSSIYKGSAEEKAKLILHVFAHEIGHVMIGEGHAEDGTSHAVLRWGNDLSKSVDQRDKLRLMCSGNNTDQKNPPKQLIKKEWDLIEDWLIKQGNKGIL